MLLAHTHLSNLALATRTCYNSFRHPYPLSNKLSDNDIDLLYRVLKTYKHQSIAEHLVFVFKVSDKATYEAFIKNPFSLCLKEQDFYLIKTNLRVLLENPHLYELIKDFIPPYFDFLLKDER